MPYFMNKGYRVFYTTHGSGYPVVLIHGYMGDIHRHWSHQFNDPLLNQHFNLIALDLRGFGKSADRSVKLHKTVDILADLRKLLKIKLKLHKPILVGYSIGAALSLAYSLLYPDDIQAILLVSPIPFIHSQIRSWSTSINNSTKTKNGIIRKSLWNLIKKANFNLLKRRGRRWEKNPAKYLLKFKNLTLPIQMVYGTRDTVTPPIAFKLLETYLPSHTEVIALPADHGISHEQPDAFNKILYNFTIKNSSNKTLGVK